MSAAPPGRLAGKRHPFRGPLVVTVTTEVPEKESFLLWFPLRESSLIVTVNEKVGDNFN
jgi:hypothetical protein